MAKARFENYNGSPALIIDGKVYPPMTATIRSRLREQFTMDKEYLAALGKAGIKVFYLICDTEWLAPGAIEMFKKEAEILLDAVPDAYIMARISTHPSEQWMKEHPEELVKYSDGIQRKALLYTETVIKEMDAMYSLCSDKWREDAGKALMETIGELEKLPYADRIIGYFLAGGGTSEWYYITPVDYREEGVYGDLSDAFRRYFKGFLDEKYGTDAVEPIVPDMESRFFANEVDYIINHPPRLYATSPAPEPPYNGTNYGSFLDVNKCQHTADFFHAWHQGTADSIIYFAKLIKEHNPDLVVGSFYGAWGWTSFIGSSNTGSVLRILDSGYVDLLANPGVYENRQPGGFVGQRQMPDSYRLRNTAYMVEEDTRTHAENRHYRDLVQVYNITDTLNVLKRNFGRNICEDLQAWWFDQHVGGGRYKFPEVYELFTRQQEIAREAYEKDRRKNSEIAFIYDEESVYIVSRQTSMETVELVRNYEIARIGAPVDQYYHNDMANPDMPDYKLYVFVNTYSLTTEERQAIWAKLRKNNATALFMYAPGLINPDADTRLDVSHVSDITGIKCEALLEKWSPKFVVDKGSHELADHLEEGRIFGMVDRVEMNNIAIPHRHDEPSYLYPVIYSDDPDATVAAHFCGNGLPAVTVKECDGFTSILCGTKYMNAAFLKEAARFAGCHIYEEEEHVLYANKNYITIHASKTGKITLKLPNKVASVYEVYERKEYGCDTDRIVLDMKLGETKMFELKY